jgi:hypothetical protein
MQTREADMAHHKEQARTPHAGSIIFSAKLFKLTIGGGLAFWVTTVATSLLPIAAEYRAASSNWSVQTVWVASFFVGMVLAGCVSYSLLRSLTKTPTKDPLMESVNLSLVALVIAVVLIDVPASMQVPGSALHYFLIGLVFNAARFLVLGLAIGYPCRRLYGPARRSRFSIVKGDTK